MNRALSTWSDRNQRGSSSGSAKSGCRNTRKKRATLKPMTVRPMRPTIAAMSIKIGMRWRAVKPHSRCASKLSPPSTPRPARKNWMPTARTNSHASPTKILRAISIYGRPPSICPGLQKPFSGSDKGGPHRGRNRHRAPDSPTSSWKRRDRPAVLDATRTYRLYRARGQLMDQARAAGAGHLDAGPHTASGSYTAGSPCGAGSGGGDGLLGLAATGASVNRSRQHFAAWRSGLPNPKGSSTGLGVGAIREERRELDRRPLEVEPPKGRTLTHHHRIPIATSVTTGHFEPGSGEGLDERPRILGRHFPGPHRAAEQVGGLLGQQGQKLICAIDERRVLRWHVWPERGILPRAHRQLLPGVLEVSTERHGPGAQELDPFRWGPLLVHGGNLAVFCKVLPLPCPDQPTVGVHVDGEPG